MNYHCSTITDFVASGSFADLKRNVQYLGEPDYAMLIRTVDLSSNDKKQPPVYISKSSYEFLSNSNLVGGEIILPNIGAVGNVYIVPKLYKHMSLAPNAIMVRSYGNDKFLYYYFKSKPGVDSLTLIGISTVQDKFNKTELRSLRVLVPPVTEQTAIATYLDTHCAKIDNLISIQQMKQSGVEWIGDVPKHWEVCKLKHYSQVVLGKMLMTSPPKDSEGLYTLEKYLKSKNVGWLQLFLDEDNIDEMWFNQYEKSIYKLQENDIVMNEGGDIGKVSCWRGVDFDCYIQNSINKITADYNRVNAGFLCYWLYNLSSLGYFWSIVSQISIAHLTKEKLSNSPVVLPPITEQAAIASYLDHKCATIDTSISNAQHQIELLQEYKQSLITEVVTGKRKVTEN